MSNMARYPWLGILPLKPWLRARVEAPAIVTGQDGGGDEDASWGGEPPPASLGWGGMGEAVLLGFVAMGAAAGGEKGLREAAEGWG